ncbi:MAG: hypothetical protein QXO70_01020 [Candidatus Pacearchaeota archaeon]
MDLKKLRAEIANDSIDPNTKLQWEFYTYTVKRSKGKIYLIKKMEDKKNIFLLIEREKVAENEPTKNYFAIGIDNNKYYLHILKGIGRYVNEEKSDKFNDGRWCFVIFNDKEFKGLHSYNKALLDKCRLLLALDANPIKV